MIETWNFRLSRWENRARNRRRSQTPRVCPPLGYAAWARQSLFSNAESTQQAPHSELSKGIQKSQHSIASTRHLWDAKMRMENAFSTPQTRSTINTINERPRGIQKRFKAERQHEFARTPPSNAWTHEDLLVSIQRTAGERLWSAGRMCWGKLCGEVSYWDTVEE